MVSAVVSVTRMASTVRLVYADCDVECLSSCDTAPRSDALGLVSFHDWVATEIHSESASYP